MRPNGNLSIIPNRLTDKEKKLYGGRVFKSVCAAFDLLPLIRLAKSTDSIVSPIPAHKESNRLAWELAKYVANKKNVEFLEPWLMVKKPQMKQLNIQDKVTVWKRIYQTRNSVSLDPENVKGRDVVIVDDLYQSGITMWAYARFLKNVGARRVFGLVCVKSMRDKDNK